MEKDNEHESNWAQVENETRLPQSTDFGDERNLCIKDPFGVLLNKQSRTFNIHTQCMVLLCSCIVQLPFFKNKNRIYLTFQFSV